MTGCSAADRSGSGLRVAVVWTRGTALELRERLGRLSIERLGGQAGIDVSGDVSLVVAVVPDRATADAVQRAITALNDRVMSRLQEWLDTRCEIRGDALTRMHDLYADFALWQRNKGYPVISEHMFSRRLVEIGVERGRHSRTRRSMCWGIALTSAIPAP